MTDVTTVSAVQAMNRISREMDTAWEQLAFWERKAVETRQDYTVAYNMAYLASEGSIPERKAISEGKTDAERLAAEHAEAEVRIWRAKMRVLENKVGVGRSNVAVLRMEKELDR